VLGVLLLVLFWASPSFAIPLSDYRDHVKKAVYYLDQLKQIREAPAETQRTEFIASLVRSVREAVPRTERVQWLDTSFETDNSWLDDDLKEWEGMPPADARRARLLDRTHERLQALNERLEETARGESAQPGKDEMKGRLTAILQRSEYGTEVKQQSALDRFIRKVLELISRLLPKTHALSPGRANIISSLAQIIIACLALAAIVYCVWLVAPRLLRKRQPKKKTKAEARVVLGERLEPDQSGADLLAEAEALARAGDLRAAIRKGYIALLVELGDRKVISLAQYKTNRDYLRSVREIEKLHGNMLKLTSSFELHWYGLAQASESDWTAFRAFYRAALM